MTLTRHSIFCGYLEALPDPDGMYMGNANIIPRQPRLYLYHAYLVYMEAHGYKNAEPYHVRQRAVIHAERVRHELRQAANESGMQTNLTLKDESNADWLPKCDDPQRNNLPQTGYAGLYFEVAYR